VVNDLWGDWSVGDLRHDPVEVQVHEPEFYLDVLLGGSIGAGRAYIDGTWSSSDLTALLRIFVRNAELTDGLEGGLAWFAGALDWLAHRLRPNTHAGSRRNIAEHYDLGNELFELFLDSTMTYSAGIFETPSSTLEQASIAKLDRVCRKLGLNPADHVLEIGTGWGSFAIHAATHYGCRVTTTTISSEQHSLAQQRIHDAGLDDRVEVLRCDYRDMDGQFDKLVSIEMVEAVGHRFLPAYFAKCASLLRDDGAMLIQGIAMPDQRYAQYLRSSDFIRKHVFPGSCCPSISAMLNALATGSDLRLIHLEDIGPHYATTLHHWGENFRNNHDAALALGYPPRFLRLWDFYLCYCEAGFEERYIGDVQMLLHKPGCRIAPLLPTLTRAGARR
jgi:cyclopropane-fatty-acyl-phospholipid synthase